MGAVVQSRCPGCKKVLRVPSNWLSQPMRCKFCGMIMQSRVKPASTAPTAREPRLSARPTPPPPTRRKTPQSLPVPPAFLPETAAVTPTPTAKPAPLARPVAVVPAPVAPIAAPVAPVAVPVVATPAAGSPWGNIELDQRGNPVSLNARRRHKRSWLGVFIFFNVLSMAAIVTYFSWSKVEKLLNPSSDQVADNTTNRSKSQSRTTSPTNTNPPATTGKQPETTTRPPETTKPPETTPRPPETTKPPETTTKPPETTERPKPPPTPPPAGAGTFPRRALIISVHNYLYANPIDPGLPVVGDRQLSNLDDALNRGLRIPMNQIAHLSDAARERVARPPLKGVIEKTLTDFLKTSRGQDHLMVFFVGHSAVIEDEVYLVPIEGELDNAATLIPLKWVYEQMKSANAKQKVLILDVNRFNPAYGLERPGSGPMADKLAAAVKAPPEGVQVWAACSEGQLSYATEDAAMGVFLDALARGMMPTSPTGGLQGKIQRQDEPYPVERLNEVVNGLMKKDLDDRMLEQVAFLSGTMMDNGVAFNAAEPAPPSPTLAKVPEQNGGLATAKLVRSVLDEIGSPPIKQTLVDNRINYDLLPPFTANFDDYTLTADNMEDTKLRKAVRNARAALWAISSQNPPPDVAKDIETVRERFLIEGDTSIIRTEYSAPADETRFKAEILEHEKKVGSIIGALEEALVELDDVADEKEKEPKRWQANYTFIKARLQAEIAYLYEYLSRLGDMRKELPPRDAKIHRGWVLASRVDLSGDSTGRKLARYATKAFDELAKEHAGTPWEVLAKREKLTTLGLEWKPVARVR